MMDKNLSKNHNLLINDIIGFIADPVVTIDSSGLVLSANKITEKYTGIPVEELVGKSFFDQNFFDAKQTVYIKEKLAQRLKGIQIDPYEITLTSKQGKVTLLEVNAKRIERSGQIFDFIVFRDVTERSQQQKALKQDLKESELKFKSISDCTFDGIIIFDDKDKIRYWNAAAQRIYGFKANEIVGKELKKTIVPDYAFELFDKIKTEFSRHSSSVKRIFEFPGLRKDGSEFPTEVSLSLVQFGSEELAVATIRDITERKNSEYALKQQHELLDAVTQNTGVALTLISKYYKILWSNLPLKGFFGEDIENKTCYKRLHKRRRVCLDCGVKRIFAGAETDTREASGIGVDGTPFSLQVTTIPVKDKKGQIYAALEIAVPITNRKQMEKKIKEAEDLYHALFEQTPLGVMVLDPQTTDILEFNSTAHNQLGYTRDEFSKLQVSDFEILEKQEEINAGISKALNSGRREFITKHRTKTGENRIVLINKQKIMLNGKEAILGTAHDVTGINRMHDALRCTEEKFYGIVNSIKDALILVDENEKITYWNPASEKTFGYTSKEVLGKKIHDLVVPDSMCLEGRNRIEQSMRVFRETGMGYYTVGNVELISRRSNGSEFPVELSLSPLRISGKWNAVGVVKDITTRKISDQKLREAEQRYHSLFNQSPLGVQIIDPETSTCIEFNDVAHLQLGYTREEFEKIPIWDIEAKESMKEVKAHIKQMMEKGGEEFETQHRTKSGEIRNVIVTTGVHQSGGKKYLQAIIHDITEIRKVQNALMASEAHYRQLVELAHEGIWAINNNFVTAFVNPRMAQMLGYTESEIVGKCVFNFLDAEMVETAKAIFEEYSAPGMSGQFEFVFPKKSGEHVHTNVSLSTIIDDQNQRIGMLAVVTDITERKQADKALAESEERFRAISTSAMDAIILSDIEDEVIYWNPAAEKTFGYSAVEAMGKKLTELVIPPSAHNKHDKLLQELINSPTSRRQLGLTAHRRNGSSFPIDLSVISVRLKDKICLLSIIRDITESKEMEEALRRERDLLESVTKSTNMVLLIIDRNYKVIWSNQTAKQVIRCDDLENKPCYETFGGSSKGICDGCGVQQVFEKGKSIVRRDYLSRIGEGKGFWLELITTPIKDKEGKVIAALEIAIDINERKQLQNKLAEYSQRLEELVQKRTEQLKKTQAELMKTERLAAIGELAGMIGHDLRNPLTGIKNAAYFLKKKGISVPPKQAQEMLQTIDKCVDYSNKIVNDLLDYSREIHLAIEEESPKTLLSEALRLMNIPKKVSVKNKLPETPLLIVDPDKIKRVFINLVKNAIDAMPSGGKVTVDSREVKGNLEIAFRDTGNGISDDILPQLFSPLFTTKAQGMGFGLAICKRIVEAHGGTIAVSTIKNHGTTFTVTLPISTKFVKGGEEIWINIPESSLSTMTKP